MAILYLLLYTEVELNIYSLPPYFSAAEGFIMSIIGAIDTIDYVQGIGNGPINPLDPCPKPNTLST